MLWTLDETALDLFARRPTRGFLTGLDFLDAPTVPAAPGRHASTDDNNPPDGYHPRQVVELCGPSDAPKMEVLLHVMAAFLTRSMDNNDGVGPAVAEQQANERVYLFDHEYESSAARLLELITSRLSGSAPDSAVSTAETDRAQQRAHQAMDRVVVCHCRDTFQWLATLNHLHFQLLESSPAPLLLVFNCVSSFHAIDKMAAKSVGQGLALSEQVFVFLKQFIRHHSPIVFAAKETATNMRASWEHIERLPSSWSSQVTKRILLRPPPPQQRQDETAKPNGSADRDAVIRFEAKCIVGGESRLFSCRVDGNAIVSEPSAGKSRPRAR